MTRCLGSVMLLLILPSILFAQLKNDSAELYRLQPNQIHRYQDDSTFSILFNLSNVFFTARDPKINNFLTKYGYIPQQNVPVGINLELAAVPFDSKMMFVLNGGTIVSRQSIVTSNFTLGAYRRFFERKSIWLMGGLGIGAHGDRIALSGEIPPNFDSLQRVYNRLLSLHHSGFLVEPAARFYWYPYRTKRLQIGLFAAAAYDFAFDSKWKLGYYNQNGQFTSFKKIGKTSSVPTQQQFGWAFSDGVSFIFKFE
jgi:hypothetical protein